MAEKIIRLSRGYAVHDVTFSEVALKPPRLADYRQIGKVIERQGAVIITYPEAIWSYVDRLMVRPDAGSIQDLDLVDAIAIEEAVIDFFTEAIKLSSGQTNSSSGSDGNRDTSTT